MKYISVLLILTFLTSISAQIPNQQQKQKEEAEDVIRITTSLVQTDVVVVDKNEKVIPDLSLQDFEIYDNGKKQDIRFLEYVGLDTGRRTEGDRKSIAAEAERETALGPSAKDVKRITAFVIDDLTIAIQDLQPIRKMLFDFVDNKMVEGDLVAIVRVVGGKGLLQQFTSDRNLLHRAINAITVTVNPFQASDQPDPVPMANPVAASAIDSTLTEMSETPEIYSANDDTVRLIRGMSTLTTAGFVIDSLREIPGRKNMVIVSAGIPIFENKTAGTDYGNVTYLLNALSDKAVRAGVVINALDPRGMRATPGVVGFQVTPGRSALGGNDANDATFGRGGALDQAVFGPNLAGGAEHLGLSTVANLTGGVSVVNTNNFSSGMDKILARSQGYYELGYAPTATFDRKFHKIDVKVKRDGAKVYHHAGYVAAEDKSRVTQTKEQQLARAAMSPLVSRDIDVTPNIAVKLVPNGKATIDIHMLIQAGKLYFNTSADGKHQNTLDIVGFLFDQMGRQLGGFSETVNLNLNAAEYQTALSEGIVYSASTEVPAGYYQVRTVVREADTGSLGTFSKYLEVPDLSKGRLAASTIFMFSVPAGQSNNLVPLLALRQLTKKQDLRYAMTVFNAKVKDGKAQVKSQVIISKGGTVLFKEPEEVLEGAANKPIVKLGQLGLAKVAAGRYILTIVVSDPTDAKSRVARSLDFNVVN